MLLVLGRISNLPTVWSNCLAAWLLNGGGNWLAFVVLCVGATLLYVGGMFLNDAFDREFDARVRSDRPIPSGDVTARETFAIGWALLAAGLALVWLRGNLLALLWAILLAGAIVFYNYRHKHNPFGPMVMGVCRGLVYCVAAAASAALTPAVVAAAAVLTVYVVALTWTAKRVGASAGWLIPLLIAGISLVDAAVVAANGGGPLIWIALAGFPATLLLQRVVPGT
jgi:4-hydroxybenzoate polyprenyltransferase